jgi:hypothetical protein
MGLIMNKIPDAKSYNPENKSFDIKAFYHETDKYFRAMEAQNKRVKNIVEDAKKFLRLDPKRDDANR